MRSSSVPASTTSRLHIVRVSHVSKSYGGVHALTDVSLDILPGEVHALCGENGAGKTTLNHILSGAVVPDSGAVLIDGASLDFGSVTRAEELGISIVHQEPTSFPDLDVVDNIFIMCEPGRLWLDKATMREQTKARLAALGESYDVNQPLQTLSFAQRQMAAIARAATNCKLLILDEPTASLSHREAQALFETIGKLKAEGTAILFVSHRLDEVFSLADKVTVLRDGHLVDTKDVASVARDELVGMMVGRNIVVAPRKNTVHDRILLQVDNLTKYGSFRNIGFSVRAGEIVALAGLVGAGRTEVAKVIAGIDSLDEGAVSSESKVAYVPEDRHEEGLHQNLSIRENISLSALKQLSSAGFVNQKQEHELAATTRTKLGIKASWLEAPARTLSGGNQQKVVLGKWLATNPQVLILDEPTHGIDVGAKAEVHALIGELAEQGVGIILISSELPEVLALSDRILVMRQGEISAEFEGNNVSEQQILDAALPRETTTSETRRSKPFPREAATAILLAITVIAAAFINPRFIEAANIRDMLIHVAPAIIVACGLTLIVIAREIDISVGSLMGVCAAVLGIVSSSDRFGLHPMLAVAACLVVGAAAGLFNGILVAAGKIPSIVVTLATLSIFRGVTELMLAGEWVQNIPPSLRQLGTGALLGIPYSVIAAATVALLAAWLATRTPFGRRVYALGSNPKAAELLGIPSRKMKLALFTLTGLLVAVATLFSATQLQVIESGFGQGFELIVVAAVVVGGTSIMGGRGSVLGTVLGCTLLGIVSTVLIFLRLGEMSTYWERAIQGAFVLAAVLADYISRRKEARA